MAVTRFGEVKEIKERHRNRLLALPNVNGVGIAARRGFDGRNEFVITVYVSGEFVGSGGSEIVPSELDGARVEVAVIGQLRAAMEAAEPNEEER